MQLPIFGKRDGKAHTHTHDMQFPSFCKHFFIYENVPLSVLQGGSFGMQICVFFFFYFFYSFFSPSPFPPLLCGQRRNNKSPSPSTHPTHKTPPKNSIVATTTAKLSCITGSTVDLRYASTVKIGLITKFELSLPTNPPHGYTLPCLVYYVAAYYVKNLHVCVCVLCVWSGSPDDLLESERGMRDGPKSGPNQHWPRCSGSAPIVVCGGGGGIRLLWPNPRPTLEMPLAHTPNQGMLAQPTSLSLFIAAPLNWRWQ